MLANFNAHATYIQKPVSATQDFIKYVTKDDTRDEAFERVSLGNVPESRQGQRTDWNDFHARVGAGASDLELAEEFPSLFYRYPNAVIRGRQVHYQASVVIEPFSPWLVWQHELANVLSNPPSDREVIWRWSNGGQLGKSTFARTFKPERSLCINGGPHADIYYAIMGRIHSLDVVFFNYPRDSAERFPYAVLENLKDRRFLNTKYESREVRFNSLHVVVFCNFPPDRTKMSADRWNVEQIDPPNPAAVAAI